MDAPKFDDLPGLVLELSQHVRELQAIVNEKLTAPDGYKPDITMNAEEVAEYMKCTVDNVHKKRRSGKLPSHQLDGVVYFIQREIDEATRVKVHKKQFFK